MWSMHLLVASLPSNHSTTTHASLPLTHPRLMRSNEVWEPWLAQIRGGGNTSLLEELNNAKTLEFLGKTFMDAYIAATTCKCADCGTWTGHLNLLSLRPTCGTCFTQWSAANLMVKSKVCTDVQQTTLVLLRSD